MESEQNATDVPYWLTHFMVKDGVLPPIHPTPDSSNVEQASYNEATSTLLVRFKGGKSYLYSDVPIEVWKNLVTAPSVGKYVRAHVVNAYKYVAIDSADVDTYLSSRTAL